MTQPPRQPGDRWQPPGTGHPTTVGYGAQYGSHYTGLGAFEQPANREAKRSKKPYFIAVVVVLILAAGGTATWLFIDSGGTVLAQAPLEKEVGKVLRNSYGERTVSNVSCPADQPVQPGHTFSCTVSISGEQKTVEIRVLNDNPTFTVGAPR